MMVDTADLVDATIIAKRAGVKPQAVSMWAARRESTQFPEPVWRPPSGRRGGLYLWWQVEAWLLHTGRRARP